MMWMKTNNGAYKAICDANLVARMWSLGVIIRDVEGRVMAATIWSMYGFDDRLTVGLRDVKGGFNLRMTVVFH
jgi:hypothetical protein